MKTNQKKLLIPALILLLFAAAVSAYLWSTKAPAPVKNLPVAGAPVLSQPVASQPELSWLVPAEIVYGTPLGPDQNNANSTTPGNFVYNPANGTVLGVGTNRLSVEFTPANPSQAGTNLTVELVVTPASLTVTANNQSKPHGATLNLGEGQSEFTAAGLVNGDSVASVTLTSAGAAVEAEPGTYPLVASEALGTGLTNYSVVYHDGSLTVKPAPPLVSWPAPEKIVYGTPLGPEQNNATATAPGSFVYTPANGTVPGAGTKVLTVVFTPDDTNFAATNLTVELVVTPAPLTVTANDASRSFAETGPVLTGTLTGLVNGDNITAQYETQAVTNCPAGTYPIVPSLVDPDGRLANYDVTSKNGTLTVNPAADLTVPLSVAPIVEPPESKVQRYPTNRLTMSLQFGLNISASFKGIAGSLNPSLNGPGHYDNGYVLTDISGNAGNQGWYWGYDKAGQINVAASTASFERTTATSTGNPSSSANDSAATPGFQLADDLQLGVKEDWHNLRYGIDSAFNFVPISINNNNTFNATATKQTDVYSYTPGTTPPSAPYQGSYQGPGFLINIPAISSTTLSSLSATVASHDDLDASLWGFHLGPYAELPFGKKEQFTLAVAGGLAVGLLAANESWSQTATIPGAGSVTVNGGGNNVDVLWGWYAGASANYQFNDHWGLAAGVQFQDLGTYNHTFDGRQVSLDLSRSILVLFGVSYHF